MKCLLVNFSHPFHFSLRICWDFVLLKSPYLVIIASTCTAAQWYSLSIDSSISLDFTPAIGIVTDYVTIIITLLMITSITIVITMVIINTRHYRIYTIIII